MIYIYTFTQGQLREYVGEITSRGARGYWISTLDDVRHFNRCGECGEVRGHTVWFEEPSKGKAISAFLNAKEKRKSDLKKQTDLLDEEIRALRRIAE